MPLNKDDKNQITNFLRHFFGNTRSSSIFDIIEALEDEHPDFANRLKENSGKLDCVGYLKSYFLTKFRQEGWLQISDDQFQVLLSTERCSYCFKHIGDIYLIDIDINRYCGWQCAEKCYYYHAPYESHLDTYHTLFDKFIDWLPKVRAFQEKNSSEDDKLALEQLIHDIEKYINGIQFNAFQLQRTREKLCRIRNKQDDIIA